MRQSKLFNKTKKEVPEVVTARSAKLLYRGDFVDQLASGIYSYLPLGWRVLDKISEVIREEMEAVGAQEVFLPSLQPKEIWEESNRWGRMDPPLFKVKDRHDREYALGSTHEEVITRLTKGRILSYRDLPLGLFQIQNKFRNEMRATGGILRTREFLMKDLYSFHGSEQGLEDYYGKVKKAYDNIYSRLELDAVAVEASTGSIGGESSNEFMIPSDSGEDTIFVCENCNYGVNAEVQAGKQDECPKCGSDMRAEKAIEAGHIFRLGCEYSEKMNAYFEDQDGQRKPLVMGCYGIGVSRLMAAIVEVKNDEDGIIWPRQVSPFDVHILSINPEGEKSVDDYAEQVYDKFKKKGVEVLFDDRDNVSVGEKFVEADLIGNPWRVVVSEKTMSEKMVEVKARDEDEEKLVSVEEAVKVVGSR